MRFSSPSSCFVVYVSENEMLCSSVRHKRINSLICTDLLLGFRKMASSTHPTGGDLVVEMTTCDASTLSEDAASCDDIAPFLAQIEKKPKSKSKSKSKINIFSVASLRPPPGDLREQVIKSEENASAVSQFFSWMWNGSRYSGVMCVAFSSVIYFIMEVVAKVFTVQSIPLFETAFSRYTVFLIFSYWWLRRSGHPIFGPAQARNILGLRSITGFLSLLTFVYCIQMAPLSQAIVLSFTTPIIAAIMARIILQEKLKIQDIGGLACSFIGLLLIFRKALTTQGGNTNGGRNHTYAVLLGLLSSVTGGVSYCLIKLGAKACDQPVTTVFSFGILACPAAGICAFILEDLVVPSFYSLSIMLVLAALAFFAELFFAHGLELEITGKVANIVYLEAALSHIWKIASSAVTLSLGQVVGCLLILVSVIYTLCTASDNEN